MTDNCSTRIDNIVSNTLGIVTAENERISNHERVCANIYEIPLWASLNKETKTTNKTF